MKLPAPLEKSFLQFNRMSMRERALIAAAVLAAVLMTWTIAVMDPMTAKTQGLRGELVSLEETLTAGANSLQEEGDGLDGGGRMLEPEAKLQSRLAELNAQLASKSAGLIEPERMVQVIHDVLSNQRGVTLVTLRNKPVSALVEPVPAADGTVPALSGPYVHRVELVIEGRYLDIMQYLKALEALPWQFYWRSLELQTTKYPLNRVQIELSTLSLEKDWIGV
jgi:MSHA biogenesis protein MshJ